MKILLCNEFGDVMNVAPSVLIVLLLSCCATTQVCGKATQDTFAEEAVVSPLADGLVLVHLQFTQTAACTRHCTTFPKAVGQLAAAIPFQSVELSLTQGRWHYHRWGAPLLQAKPAGAELRAHFSPALSPDALPGLWGNLSHALGGLFCASLNFVARPEATAPLTIDMQPAAAAAAATYSSGLQQDQSKQQQQQERRQRQQEQKREATGVGWAPGPALEHVLYASLPQEASCTENLTPWLKLLPCRDAAGLGRLLTQRGVVFGADYHSMQVNIDVQRDQQHRPTHTTLRQTFTMVLRSPSSTSSSSGGNPPKPGTVSDISLGALLGSDVPNACPVAATSRLLLQVPQHVQQQGALQDSLQLPAYAAGAAAPAEADATEGEVDSAEGSSSVGPQVTVRRANSWSSTGLTLKPAPDAAAALPPTGPACIDIAAATAAAGSTDTDNTETVGVLHDDWTSHACRPLLFYVWDLQRNVKQFAAATADDDVSGALPFSVQWQQQATQPNHAAAAAASTAAAVQQSTTAPQFSVARYITGTGQLHGGMALQLTAVQATGLQDAEVSRGNMAVCILQVVPWYIRLWLHTLKLSIDGKATPLEEALLPSYISPAQDRKQPLVLDLCISAPKTVRSITLTAQFTKAFLRMLEHPPDAHRGFDVPAAVVTVGAVPPDILSSGSQAVQDTAVNSSSRSDSASSCHGGQSSGVERAWRVVVAGGAPGADELQKVTPLMAQLMQQRPPLVYSPGLVVPLAVPDFSMPYNVICLTSTVLAIFMGGVLNALLWRPGKDEREAADPKTVLLKQRKKRVRLVVLVVAFLVVAVYFDADLQQEILKQARALGLLEPVSDEL